MNITKIVSNGYIFSIVMHDYINNPIGGVNGGM